MPLYAIGNVLFGDDERVEAYIRQRIPAADPLSKYVALGILCTGELVGGAAFFNYHKHDIEVSFACDSFAWARPETLKTLFSFPFIECGCVRATARTGRKNKRARALLEHLGCKLEGVVRKGFDGKQDMCVYGLLRSECRWI